MDGKDYLFIDRDEFERLREAGGLLEWFDVYGDLKGTPRAPVEEHLAAGDDVLLELDVQGALAVKENYPEHRRLAARGQDDPEAIERRLAQADAEEALADRFDAVVVNDDPDRGADEVAAILNAYREARTPPEPGSPPPAGLPDR